MKTRKLDSQTSRARRVGARRPRNVALLELLEALARAANEATSSEAAMRTCLERMFDYGRWTVGRVAILKAGSPTSGVQASIWHGDDTERFAEFVRASENHHYMQPSGRFTSAALREKRAVWIADFEKIGGRARLATAVATGLHSGFSFPIIVHGEVAAFIEFFGNEPRKADSLLLGAIGSVGSQLGRLIERDRAAEAQARLAAIVESSQDAIVSTAPDRTILTWNAGAERMFGYKAAETLGRDVKILLPEERHGELPQRRRMALAGQQAPPHESERFTKDGRRVPVSVSASPLTDAGGKVTGVALIYRDICELKRVQFDLERQARLSRLMASLVHTANEATSAETAMPSCLDLISKYGDWTLGRVATFAAGQRLGAPQSSVWYCTRPAHFAEFIEVSNRYIYRGRPSGQFVSEALRNKMPVWVGDLSTTTGFGRLADAEKCGLRSGFVFPVVVAGESLAFLEFFADEVKEPDAPFLEAIGSVAAQLARLIERARAEAARAQLATIVETSGDAIISRDLDLRILTWNAAAERLFGYGVAEAIGQSISMIIPPDQTEQVAQNREILASGVAIPATDAVRLAKDGSAIDVSIAQSPIKDAGGKIVGVSLIFRDITERKQAEEKIRQLAHYDNLTGLPNRALFYDRLGQAIGLARRERYEVALMYVDLDRFKAVNDMLGHGAGDELLQAVADRIRARLRETDTVARMGGDEFIAILPKIAYPPDAEKVARKVLDALSAPFPLAGAGQEVAIGASIGIAVYPGDAEDMDALIKAADAAMYEAKQTRNDFRFYNKSKNGVRS